MHFDQIIICFIKQRHNFTVPLESKFGLIINSIEITTLQVWYYLKLHTSQAKSIRLAKFKN